MHLLTVLVADYFFGISNDNQIVGLQDAEHDAEIISEQIKTRLNPIPNFNLKFQTVEEKVLIVLDVYAGDQTPYYYDADGTLIAFHRVGNESVPVTPAKLQELVIKGSVSSYDCLKSKYDFENKAFTKLKSTYKQRTGNKFEDSDYESFGIVDENGALTNAGALLADESPVRHSRLFCTRWNGLDKAPGGMCDGTRVQERDLMRVPSRRRNPVIADIFNRLKYMDRRGSGFKKILSDYRTQPNYTESLEPEFFLIMIPSCLS